MDLLMRNHCHTLRLDGVTAAMEERHRDHRCFLKTLSNTRHRPVTVALVFPDGREMRFTLTPFQKVVFCPPVLVAEADQGLVCAFNVEREPQEASSSGAGESASDERTRLDATRPL